MKFITMLSLLLLTSPAIGELTGEDLRTIIREEIEASEKRTREYIDLKNDVLDKSLSARIDAVNTKIDAVDRSLGARIDAVNTRIDAVNTRIDGVDKRLGDMRLLMIGFIGVVAAIVAVPQIIIAYKDRDWKQTRAEIQKLREKVEALQNASP